MFGTVRVYFDCEELRTEEYIIMCDGDYTIFFECEDTPNPLKIFVSKFSQSGYIP